MTLSQQAARISPPAEAATNQKNHQNAHEPKKQGNDRQELQRHRRREPRHDQQEGEGAGLPFRRGFRLEVTDADFAQAEQELSGGSANSTTARRPSRRFPSPNDGIPYRDRRAPGRRRCRMRMRRTRRAATRALSSSRTAYTRRSTTRCFSRRNRPRKPRNASEKASDRPLGRMKPQDSGK